MSVYDLSPEALLLESRPPPPAPITLTNEAFLELVIRQTLHISSNPYVEPSCHSLISTFKSLKHYYGIDTVTENHCFQALLLFSADKKVPFNIRVQRLSKYLKVSEKNVGTSDHEALANASIALDDNRLIPVTRQLPVHYNASNKRSRVGKHNSLDSLSYIKKSPQTKVWSTPERIRDDYAEGRDLSIILNGYDDSVTFNHRLESIAKAGDSILHSSSNYSDVGGNFTTNVMISGVNGRSTERKLFSTPEIINMKPNSAGRNIDMPLTMSALGGNEGSPHSLAMDTPSLTPLKPSYSQTKVRFSKQDEKLKGSPDTTILESSSLRSASQKKTSIPELRAAKHWEQHRYRKGFNQFRLYSQHRMGNLIYEPGNQSPSRVVKRKGRNSFAIEFRDESDDRDKSGIQEKSPTISRMQRLRLSYGLTSGYNPNYTAAMMSKSRLDPIPTASTMKILAYLEKYFIGVSYDHLLHGEGRRHPSPVLLVHMDKLQDDIYQRVTGQEKWLRDRVWAFVTMHTVDLCFRLWSSQTALINLAKSHYLRYCVLRGFEAFQGFALFKSMKRLGISSMEKLDRKLSGRWVRKCFLQWRKKFDRSLNFLSLFDRADLHRRDVVYNAYFMRWRAWFKSARHAEKSIEDELHFLQLRLGFMKFRHRTHHLKKFTFLAEKVANTKVERVFFSWLRISPVLSKRDQRESVTRRYSQVMSNLCRDDSDVFDDVDSPVTTPGMQRRHSISIGSPSSSPHITSKRASFTYGESSLKSEYNRRCSWGSFASPNMKESTEHDQVGTIDSPDISPSLRSSLRKSFVGKASEYQSPYASSVPCDSADQPARIVRRDSSSVSVENLASRRRSLNQQIPERTSSPDTFQGRHFTQRSSFHQEPENSFNADTQSIVDNNSVSRRSSFSQEITLNDSPSINRKRSSGRGDEFGTSSSRRTSKHENSAELSREDRYSRRLSHRRSSSINDELNGSPTCPGSLHQEATVTVTSTHVTSDSPQQSQDRPLTTNEDEDYAKSQTGFIEDPSAASQGRCDSRRSSQRQASVDIEIPGSEEKTASVSTHPLRQSPSKMPSRRSSFDHDILNSSSAQQLNQNQFPTQKSVSSDPASSQQEPEGSVSVTTSRRSSQATSSVVIESNSVTSRRNNLHRDFSDEVGDMNASDVTEEASNTSSRRRGLSLDHMENSSVGSFNSPKSVHALGRRHSLVLQREVSYLLSPTEEHLPYAYDGKNYIKEMIASWYRASCISDIDRITVHFTKWQVYVTRSVNLQNSVCAMGDLRFKIFQFQKFKQILYDRMARHNSLMLAYCLQNGTSLDSEYSTTIEDFNNNTSNWSIAGVSRLMNIWKDFTYKQVLLYDKFSRNRMIWNHLGVVDENGTAIDGNSGFNETLLYKLNFLSRRDGLVLNWVDISVLHGFKIFLKKYQKLSISISSIKKARVMWNVKSAKVVFQLLRAKVSIRRRFDSVILMRARILLLKWKVRKVEQARLRVSVTKIFRNWRTLSSVHSMFGVWFESNAIPLLRRGFRKIKEYSKHCEECIKTIRLVETKRVLKSAFRLMKQSRDIRLFYIQNTLRRTLERCFTRPLFVAKRERSIACRRQLKRWLGKQKRLRNNFIQSRSAQKHRKKRCLIMSVNRLGEYTYAHQYQVNCMKSGVAADRLIKLLRGMQMWRFFQERFYLRNNIDHINYFLIMSFWKFSRRLKQKNLQRSLIEVANGFHDESLCKKFIKKWYQRTKRKQLMHMKFNLSESFHLRKNKSFAFVMLSRISK